MKGVFDIIEVVNSFCFLTLTIFTFFIPCIAIQLLQFKPTKAQILLKSQ